MPEETDVRRGGGTDAPVEFRWRGQLHRVREVLSHHRIRSSPAVHPRTPLPDDQPPPVEERSVEESPSGSGDGGGSEGARVIRMRRPSGPRAGSVESSYRAHPAHGAPTRADLAAVADPDVAPAGVDPAAAVDAAAGDATDGGAAVDPAVDPAVVAGGAADGGTAVTGAAAGDAADPGEPVARWHDQEVWRVSAVAAENPVTPIRPGVHGLFDLRFDWTVGRWTVTRIDTLEEYP